LICLFFHHNQKKRGRAPSNLLWRTVGSFKQLIVGRQHEFRVKHVPAMSTTQEHATICAVNVRQRLHAILAPLSCFWSMPIFATWARNHVRSMSSRSASHVLLGPPPPRLIDNCFNHNICICAIFFSSLVNGNFDQKLSNKVKQSAGRLRTMFEAKQDVRVHYSLLKHVNDNFGLPTLATKRRTEFS